MKQIIIQLLMNSLDCEDLMAIRHYSFTQWVTVDQGGTIMRWDDKPTATFGGVWTGKGKGIIIKQMKKVVPNWMSLVAEISTEELLTALDSRSKS